MAEMKQKKEDSANAKTQKPHYSLTPNDIALIEKLRRRYQSIALEKKTDSPVDIAKSEIVRAGISVLNGLSDAQFYRAVESLEKLSKGRPEKK